jgi:hypothetical protein
MKNITIIDLQVRLAQLRTATFATITTITEPSMNKGGNPFYGRLTKKTVSEVTLNFIYANSVNTQREKENKSLEETPVFVPHARKWGEKIQGTCLVQHKGNVYVEARFGKQIAKSEYFCDGAPIAKTEIAMYLKESNSNAEHQGVSRENEVIMRDYKLSNVAALTLKLNPIEVYNII